MPTDMTSSLPVASFGASAAVFPSCDDMSLDTTGKLTCPASVDSYLGRIDPGIPSGGYRLPFAVTGVIADRAPDALAVVHGWPFFVARSTKLDLVRLHLVTALTGVAAMCGVYGEEGNFPCSLLEDLGTADLTDVVELSGDLMATATVAGWFWVLVWVKGSVATAETVGGPNSSLVPGSTHGRSYTQNSKRGHLALALPFPSCMPARAPTGMTRQTGLNAPVPMIRAA